MFTLQFSYSIFVANFREKFCGDSAVVIDIDIWLLRAEWTGGVGYVHLVRGHLTFSANLIDLKELEHSNKMSEYFFFPSIKTALTFNVVLRCMILNSKFFQPRVSIWKIFTIFFIFIKLFLLKFLLHWAVHLYTFNTSNCVPSGACSWRVAISNKELGKWIKLNQRKSNNRNWTDFFY